MLADKTKTIKGATDQELTDLLIRLRKESDLQNIIAGIKRQAMPNNGYGLSNNEYGISTVDTGVSTEQAIEGLYHIGVLGMHWGKRKGGNTPSRVVKKKAPVKKASTTTTTITKTTNKTVDDSSSDHAAANAIRKKSLRQMTNAELKDFTARLQLEKQFKDLTKTEMSPGRKFIQDVVVTSAKSTATTYVTKYMGKGVEALLKKAMKP